MKTRGIKKIVNGQHQIDGAGVHLVRVIGYYDVKDFDPFLMLDAFDSHNPEDYIKGFPWHPHRGIETVTYLIHGRIDHGDSLGNRGVILDGGCQWMTAGSGILHQEMPQPEEWMLGFQLWVNLPRKDKMTEPKYRDLSVDKVPVVKDSTSEVRIVSGHYKGKEGATQGDYVKTLLLDVTIQQGEEWSLEVQKDATLFIYIVEGSGYFGVDEELVTSKNAILFDGGELFKMKATDEGTRFMLFSGMPLKEPIAWGGPIVMNTKEELNRAFEELDEGTFIKHK